MFKKKKKNFHLNLFNKLSSLFENNRALKFKNKSLPDQILMRNISLATVKRQSVLNFIVNAFQMAELVLQTVLVLNAAI